MGGRRALGLPIMTNAHRRFVQQQNIRDFEEKIAKETDPEKRMILEELIDRERALSIDPIISDVDQGQ